MPDEKTGDHAKKPTPEAANALSLYRQAAAQGDPQASWRTFEMIEQGLGLDDEVPVRDLMREALERLRAAADGGLSEAERLAEAYEAARRISSARGEEWLLKRLWASSSTIRYLLVAAYLDPDDERHDEAAALALVERLTHDDDTDVLFLLVGAMLEAADERLRSTGRQMAGRASEALGQPWTNRYITELMRGDGGPVDIAAAFALLRRQVRAGCSEDEAERAFYAHQCAMLAEIYAGRHGEQWRDESLATEWMQTGARLGDPHSAFNLGVCHQNGELGLVQDNRAAEDAYRHAISLGSAKAATNLALLILKRQIPGDESEAFDLLSSAAERGETSAVAIVEKLDALSGRKDP